MNEPRGDARTAANASRDARAMRSKTGDNGSGTPPRERGEALGSAPVEGLAGAAEGTNVSGASARSPVRSVYAALDLGTNNCRLLVAKPSRRGFVVIDAFSRIIRLGEGVQGSGKLSKDAMDRTINALRVCADKMRRRGVTRSRLIATEACRIAVNSAEFVIRRHRAVVHIRIWSPIHAGPGVAVLAATGLVVRG